MDEIFDLQTLIYENIFLKVCKTIIFCAGKGVILDSRNITQYLSDTYNSNVRFLFEEGLYFPTTSIQITCSLLNFICPNSIYIINENNNLLSLTINSVVTNYYITYGNYNSTTFITYLTSILPTGFIITINWNTNILS